MMEKENSNGLQIIISQAIETLKAKYGKTFNLDKVNLAELQRMTGISRSRLRRLQKNHFVVQPHGRIGLHARVTVLSGFTGVLDLLLHKDVKNSLVCFERLYEIGYTGSLTQIKVYIWVT